MKQISILLFLLSLVSCGKKKNLSGEKYQLNQDHTGVEVKNLDPSIDSDYDGILNSTEAELGLNPLVSDIPEVSLEVRNIKLESLTPNSSLNLDYSEKGKTKFERFKRLISTYAYNKRYNKDYSISPYTFDFQYQDELNCINEFQKDDLKNLSISNPYEQKINLEIKKLNYESDIFKIISQSIKLNQFEVFDQFKNMLTIDNREEFINEDCIALSFSNIKYKVKEKIIELKDIKTNIENELSHIIVLTNEDVEIKNIVPNAYSMKSFLEEFYPSATIQNNEVTELHGLKNDFHSDNELLTDDDKLKMGRWFYLSSDKISMSEKLNKGETYILAYLTIEDLSKVAELRSKNNLNASKSTSFSSDVFQEGDTVELTGLFTINFNIAQSNGNIRYEYNTTELNKLINQTKSNKDLCIKLVYSGRLVCPKIKGRNITYKIKLEKADIKDSNFSFNFSPLKLNQFSYTRIIRTVNEIVIVRPGGRPIRDRHITEARDSVNTPEILNLNLTISHFGLPR